MNTVSNVNVLMEQLNKLATKETINTFESAMIFAMHTCQHKYLTADHVFLWLISNSEKAAQSLSALRVKGEVLNNLKEELKLHLEQSVPNHRQVVIDGVMLSESIIKLVREAGAKLAPRTNQEEDGESSLINENDLLMAAFNLGSDVYFTSFLHDNGLTIKDLENYLTSGVEKEEKLPDELNCGIINSSSSTPMLSQYAVLLNKQEDKTELDNFIGRENEIEQVINILSQRRKGNPVLVGDPGVGKTAIAEGLARKIIKGEVPDDLKDAKIYMLNLMSLCAGTKFRGDYEERLGRIIKEATEDKNIILFIDEIHNIVNDKGSAVGVEETGNLLKPVLSRGSLRVIGATTYTEYSQFFEKDAALSRRFQKVDVLEPSPDEAKHILYGIAKHYEDFHGVSISRSVIDLSVDLSVKYMSNKKLPDKAIDIMDAVGASVKLLNKVNVKQEDVRKTVSKITGIPVSDLNKTEKEKLKLLSLNLKEVVYGQDDAIDQVADAVIYNKAIGNIKEKPISTFLFAGSSGVGKTELAKNLSEILGVSFIRFDMSEYMESHSVSKLIGSPPGYVGHESSGLLTEKVNNSPYSVLLLDEIEKADRKIINILLQVMDYGFLTDSKGKKVDFRNIILIMTTNLGAESKSKSNIGFNVVDSNFKLESLKSHFSPEFLNRIDAAIQFSDVDSEVMRKVAKKHIGKLKVRLKERGIDLKVSSGVIDFLISQADREMTGARKIERLVEDMLAKPISKKIIFESIENSTVLAAIINDKIDLTAQTNSNSKEVEAAFN